MIKDVKKEKNYWPHAIVIVLILMIFACSMVVKIAMDNPVQMDSFYLEKYQNVDKNINKIMAAQKEFEKSYALEYKTNKFVINDENTFVMSIKDLEKDSYVQKADITLVISRPETNEFNQEFKINSAKDGVFAFENIKVNKPGRWQILTRININDKSSYNKFEVFATK